MLSFRLKNTFFNGGNNTFNAHEETKEANSQRCGVSVYKGYIRKLRFVGGVAFGTLKTRIVHGQKWTYITYEGQFLYSYTFTQMM